MSEEPSSCDKKRHCHNVSLSHSLSNHIYCRCSRHVYIIHVLEESHHGRMWKIPPSPRPLVHWKTLRGYIPFQRRQIPGRVVVKDTLAMPRIPWHNKRFYIYISLFNIGRIHCRVLLVGVVVGYPIDEVGYEIRQTSGG